MAKRYVLGIDTGTSAVKAVLADLRGVEVCVRTEFDAGREPPRRLVGIRSPDGLAESSRMR